MAVPLASVNRTIANYIGIYSILALVVLIAGAFATRFLVTLTFRTLNALRVFDVFFVFFGNRQDTQTMAVYAQSTIVGDGHVGYGAAISVAYVEDGVVEAVDGHARSVDGGS